MKSSTREKRSTEKDFDTMTARAMSQHDLRLMGEYLHMAGKSVAQFDGTQNVTSTLSAFGDYYFTLHERVAVTHRVKHLTASSRVSKPTKQPSPAGDTSIVLSSHDVCAAIHVLHEAARSALRHETVAVPNVVHALNGLAEQYGIVWLSMIETEKTNMKGNKL